MYSSKHLRVSVRCHTKAVNQLKHRHPAFAKLIKLIGKTDGIFPKWKSADDAILYSVIGQSLSNKSAHSIISKLMKTFGSSKTIILWAEKTKNKKGPLNGVSQRKRKALSVWLAYSTANPGRHKQWIKMSLEAFRSEICVSDPPTPSFNL